jgi:peptidoglycan hydrolase-like protein with peptidoglycan-binding domain
MARFVRRITVVPINGSAGNPQEIYKKKRKKKRKVSSWLKPIEKSQRKFMKAADKYTSEALRRHDKSNKKRRDGWLDDVITNQTRSMRKAYKKLW